MEEADNDWMMIRMVGGQVFLLVLAQPGSPRQSAIKRLLLFVYGAREDNMLQNTNSLSGHHSIQANQ